MRIVIGQLKDRVALVTGASRGIGRAIAVALAHEGATVCLVGRDDAALKASAALCGGSAAVYSADLARDQDIAEVAARLGSEVGGLDIVVHAAGIIVPGQTAEATPADFDAQYRINVRAPWTLTRAVLPLLCAPRGQIVFVNSTAGLRANAGVGQYASTKHALRAIADTLRDELNADGVRVTSVYVGRTATSLQQALHAREGRPWRPERLIQPDDVAAVVLHALTLPRTVEMTDVTIRPLQKPV
jgi:NADP-dependent 3-hydroxy acid dehydrogenase YdfG